jgi:hypothetical protein
MRRLCLSALTAALAFAVAAGCGGSTSSEPTSTVSKEEIERAMQKMKKLGPKAHE